MFSGSSGACKLLELHQTKPNRTRHNTLEGFSVAKTKESGGDE